MSSPKIQKQSINWMLAEDIPDIDFAFSQIWLSCFTNEFAKPNGRAYQRVATYYQGYHLWFYYDHDDAKTEGDHIVNRFIQEPAFATQVNKEILHQADRLRRFTEKLPETGLEKQSNTKLWQLYTEHDRLHTEYYQWCWIPVAADMFHNNLTDRMKQYLATQGVPEAKVNEVFVALTHPRSISLIQKEREDFLHIAFAIQKNAKQKKLFADIYSTFLNKEAGPYGWQTHTEEFEHGLEQRADQLIDAISPEILKRIQKHYASYFYVPRMWIGETAHFTYYLKELVKLIGQKSDIAALLKEEKKKLQTANSLRERYLRQYRISGKWKTLFLAFGDFMVTKIYRRFAQIYALYKMEFLQKEIARRLHISLKEMRFMLPKEVHAALTRGHLSRSMLKQRVKECVYISEKNRDTILVGAAAKRMKKQLQSMKHESSEELHGQTGCVGKATGRVKIIIRPKDMAKMQRGDILVSIATDPDIVAAMKKAAAIVTEQGGVTSHAAIVSRELKIPCVIGTKIATKVLKDGDQVEVDATKGIVRKL